MVNKQKSSRFFKEFYFQNFSDADIRATLNSYQYFKRLLSERLDKQAPIMVFFNIFILIKFAFLK
jgi:hypothetical protein